RTWTHRQLTSDPNGYAIRPVTPRGQGQSRNRILYVWGDERTIGFTDYTTRVHAPHFGGAGDPDVPARARAGRDATHAAVCDVLAPWAHGTVARATSYPSYFD